MKIITKRYKLPTKKYIGIALGGVLKQQWWVFAIFLAICAGYLWIPNHWWITGASIALVLYFLFWLIQFAGVTQLEQGKFLFEKLVYEITSQQILIKLNARQGMPMRWEQIKRAKMGRDEFTLFISKAQLIHLPHRLFKNENEIRFMETILKRKGLVK